LHQNGVKEKGIGLVSQCNIQAPPVGIGPAGPAQEAPCQNQEPRQGGVTTKVGGVLG